VKLSEYEENDWNILQPLQVQYEKYAACDSALEVCGIQSITQKLDQHLTMPEEGEELENRNNILGPTERTGSSQEVHVSIRDQEQYYCNVQHS
jgi:hypothetical protein